MQKKMASLLHNAKGKKISPKRTEIQKLPIVDSQPQGIGGIEPQGIDI